MLRMALSGTLRVPNRNGGWRHTVFRESSRIASATIHAVQSPRRRDLGQLCDPSSPHSSRRRAEFRHVRRPRAVTRMRLRAARLIRI